LSFLPLAFNSRWNSSRPLNFFPDRLERELWSWE